MKSLINPFELLGINEKSTLKDARKAYYNIALLCHPDCCWDENSMRVLVNAYKFVEKQLKTVRNVSENIGKDLKNWKKDINILVKNLKVDYHKLSNINLKNVNTLEDVKWS